jgi:23S rRNA pseudouridine1911/1915/1917 synthase
MSPGEQRETRRHGSVTDRTRPHVAVEPMMGSPRLRLAVESTEDGLPIDELLSARVATLSRRRARLLLELGGVFIDGARAGGGAAVHAGQQVELLLGGALERASLDAERGAFGPRAPSSDRASSDRQHPPRCRVLWEDEDICVVDKPSGLVTPASPSGRPSVVGELQARPGAGRLWVVQRLDAPTSGVLVLAKTIAANRALSRRMQRHAVDRSYFAVVRGEYPEALQRLDAPLRGRRALTRVRVLARHGRLATQLGCTLETGRTHQIRLHCALAGHPVLGDPRHGQRTAWEPPRLALHAARLGFEHPRTAERLVFESPLPQELVRWLEQLEAIAREAEG